MTPAFASAFAVGLVLGLSVAAVVVRRFRRGSGAAEARLGRVVASSPAVLYTLEVADQTLRPGWVSDNIEQLIGYTAHEVNDPAWWEKHLHPEDKDRLLAQDTELLDKGHRERDYRLLRKDGGYTWVRDQQRLLRDGEGNATEVVGSWSDVTAQKGVERRLLESEEQYRRLFDSNPHPMWVFDHETLRFLAVNDAAIALYGFSRDEFLAMTIKDIRPAEEVPALLEHLASMSESSSEVATQIRHRKKDGSPLEVAGASNPIEFRGRRARLVLANDISERKGLEAQLVQAQKMEAVGRLAGGVAHDFNNLLGVITGYSELLLKNLGPEHPGANRVFEIQKAAQRGAGLTRQLLAFSRQQALQPRILDLNEVVADVESMLRRLIGEDVHLVTTRGAALGRILADPGQIEQVLMNLVVNARDAMPKGGGLILETANVALDSAYAQAHPGVKPGPFVMLSVTDTGEGMNARTKAHMFEPFFTTKEAGRGTGLGLATVFGIVQQSGGTVGVESEVGVGTTCRIYFPRVDDALVPSSRPPGTPSPQGTETILLVEDEDALRVIIREILEGGGYTVLESSDPDEALFRVSTMESAIDLLLTDVVMPGMSGPELASSVQVARPGIKVLYMSGYTDEAMGLHGVLDASTQFIQKPFSADALLRKVREAVDAA